VNPAASRFSGYSEDELLGMNLRDLLAPQVRHMFDDYLHEIKAKGAASGSMLVLSKSGEKRIWEYDNSLRRRENALPIVRSTSHDVTERRRTEQMLRRAQKVEAIGQLAGGVAHDFNNILMAITGYCELLLLKTDANGLLQELVLEIKEVATQGASLTKQLLAFSRQQIMESSVLDLNDVIKKMAGMLGRLIKENIEVSYSLGENLGYVKSDPGQIEQVVMNLVINSGDAMPSGGVLKIETANVTLLRPVQGESGIVEPGNYVTISIQDSGTGMDEVTKGRIFEPFFTTKEAGKGTGLGLSTVYGIVKQSGGYTLVQSVPDQGTTFTIYLPRLENQEKPTLSEEPVNSLLPTTGKECILVVDDNDAVRGAVSSFLEMYGYSVLTAANGEEGMQVTTEHAGAIDLVITDVVMPQMGGVEFVKMLIANRPGIRVIYMSGYSLESAALLHDKNPNFIHLQKPTSMSVLMETIRRLLSQNSVQ